MSAKKFTLQNRVTTLLIVFSLLFIAIFTVIQLNNQLNNINRFNSYQANLSSIIVKNNLETVLKQKDDSEYPRYIQSNLDSLVLTRIIKEAVVFNQDRYIIASTINSLTGKYVSFREVAKFQDLESLSLNKWNLTEIDKLDRRLNIYLPLKRNPQEPILLVAKISFSLGNIQEALADVYKQVAFSVTLIILTNILLGYILSKTVIGPIKVLNEVTKIIASGDLSVRTAIDTDDELAELGTTFNYMTEELIKMKSRAENANPLTKRPGNLVTSEEGDKRECTAGEQDVKRDGVPLIINLPPCPSRERGTKGDRVTEAGDDANLANEQALDHACALLRNGKTLAVKGLGGFLLACDATNDAAVKTLRARKHRLAKPFAVMIETIAAAREHCPVGAEEEWLLTSPASPIVLLARRPGSSLAPSVAPGLKYMGVMLPYTPLHHLLMRRTGRPLVMTSGNLSEEPIAKDNDEALTRLNNIADYFLMHNRDIYSRYDDSVTLVASGRTQIVRRARGYAPYPVHLGFDSRPVLACGAELKNTFCLTKDAYAFVGQHIGDMENLETLEHFEQTEALYERLFRVKPEIIACDLHPDYLPTRWAEARAKKDNLPLVHVQHHHAHIVSCMADNGVAEPVIGVALDGTGYGTDGNIWGGEFLLADYRHFERKAHLEYLPLPGGAAAIQRPYRTAIGYLYALLGQDAVKRDLPCLKGVDDIELELIEKQVDRSLNTPLTSSCGRLFDAVSALLGIRREIEYEGQAAIELEMAADDSETGAYPYVVSGENIKLGGLFEAILADLAGRVPAAVISARFHNTVALMVSEVSAQISRETGIRRVALSGGVLQNRWLLGKVLANLEVAGLEPLVHRQVPCNDGGISLGQAVAANYGEGV